MIASATPANIESAAERLLAGELVVMPTETVYGLAGDATNATAVARIFEAKGRPHFNPLIAHVLTLADAEAHGVLPAKARELAEQFWPGPLTLVVERRAHSPVAELACAGLSTIALRVPAHPVARALLEAVGRPLAAPSANRSGSLSPTRAEHAAEDLAASVSFVLDGGPCRLGLESTIVAIDPQSHATLLRAGAISREEIEALIGPLAAAQAGAISAPGMLTSHYAPRAALRLNAHAAEAGEVLLGFGASSPEMLRATLNLSPSGDLVEAAAHLYAFLRDLDAANPGVIAVAPIPNYGLGEAINDRLARAAAPRS